MAEGVQDYLVKGQIDSRLLRRVIHYATHRKRMQEALRCANEELERRVKERTRELAEKGRILEAFFATAINPIVFLDKELHVHPREPGVRQSLLREMSRSSRVATTSRCIPEELKADLHAGRARPELPGRDSATRLSSRPIPNGASPTGTWRCCRCWTTRARSTSWCFAERCDGAETRRKKPGPSFRSNCTSPRRWRPSDDCRRGSGTTSAI